MRTLCAGLACLLLATMVHAADPTFHPISSLALADGRTLVAGASRGDSGYTFAVRRLLPGGTVDPTFGDGGIAEVPFWRYYEFASVLVPQPDGKLLVGGNAADPIMRADNARCHPAFCRYYPVVARLHPDGSLDATFNEGGRIALAVGGANEDPAGVQAFGTLTGLSVAPDGAIDVAADGRAVVARLTPDGRLDRAFRNEAMPVAHEVVFARTQGLWHAPGADGWRLALAEQGRTLFGVWFLEDETGTPAWGSWLLWVATKIGAHAYEGPVYATRGPDFHEATFDASRVVSDLRGSASIVVDGAGEAAFSWQLGTRSGTRRLRMTGVQATCTWGTQSKLELATNFDGHWWSAPPGSEPGWGLHLTHRGEAIHLAWMTYGEDGAPLWLASSVHRRADGTFAGPLLRQLREGGPHGAAPGDFVAIGTAGLAFADGNRGTFTYAVDGGISRSKPITRLVFEAPGTICSP